MRKLFLYCVPGSKSGFCHCAEVIINISEVLLSRLGEKGEIQSVFGITA